MNLFSPRVFGVDAKLFRAALEVEEAKCKLMTVTGLPLHELTQIVQSSILGWKEFTVFFAYMNRFPTINEERFIYDIGIGTRESMIKSGIKLQN